MARAITTVEQERLEERFGLRGPIGAGQCAQVFAAWDHRRECMVALKTLNEQNEAAISRFKSEFRSLADVSHPNVVKLYDLISDGEIWLMTMELVDGVDLREFQKEAAVGEILKIYEGIARGLNAIHQSGHLHCDLRPANVKIDKKGRPVLLDFGFVARLRHASALLDGRRSVLGSVAYAAPEVIRGSQATPASDWYGFGTMLYEALVGQTPFRASNISQLMLRKASADAPSPETISSLNGCSAEVISRLLTLDPDERPGFCEIMDVLGASPENTSAGPRKVPFIGRDEDLEELRQCFDSIMVESRPIFVSLTGDSGIGKTRLADRFLEECREATGFIYRSRCHENEHLPFLALDAIIEDLAKTLADFETNDGLKFVDGDLQALAQVFPAFRQIPSVAIRAAGDRVISEETRIAAFNALATTLTRMGKHYPVVIFLDDIQWGDTDSADFVARFLAANREGTQVMFIAACRSEERNSCRFLGTIMRDPDATETMRRIELEPLGEEEQVRLAAELDFFPRNARHIISQARGNPFLLTEFARHSLPKGPPPGDLDALYKMRIQGLRPEDLHLVKTLALLGRPVGLDVLSYLVDDETNLQRAITRLKNERVVRVQKSNGRVQIEMMHDRIRDSLIDEMWWNELVERHHDIAQGLGASGSSDAESLYHHYLLAGVPSRAAQFAFEAADHSVDVLAFGHAADLIRTGVEIGELDRVERKKRLEELASYESHLHRRHHAASAYLRAIKDAKGPSEQLRLRLQAAAELVRGGDLDDGFPLLYRCLDSVDSRPPEGKAQVYSHIIKMRNRLELASIRPSKTASLPTDLEVSWTAARLMAHFDTGAGLYLSLRNLEHAIITRNGPAIARALTLYADQEIKAAPQSTRAWAALERASELLESIEGRSSIRAQHRATRAMLLREEGEFAQAIDSFDAASRLYEHSIGDSWNASSVRLASMRALALMGRFEDVRAAGSELMSHSDDVGDQTHSVGARIWCYLAHLAADDPQRAHTNVDCIASWSKAQILNQHLWAALARMSILLYEGRAERAIDLGESELIEFEDSFVMRSRLNRVDFAMRMALASTDMAARASTAGERGPWVDRARLHNSKLRRETVVWAEALADLIDSQIAFVMNQTQRSSRRLRSAQETFRENGLTVYSWAAQWMQGLLMGGASGERAIEQVRASMHENGVKAPDRFIRTVLSV